MQPSRPIDRVLATASTGKEYPLEINRAYDAFSLYGIRPDDGPCQHYFHQVYLTRVWVQRKLRWYHHALNALGAQYTELKCIEVDIDQQVLWYNTLESVAVRHLPQVGIYVSCNTWTGELFSNTSNVDVLGYDLKVVVGERARKRR